MPLDTHQIRMAWTFGFFIIFFLFQRLRKIHGLQPPVPEPCLINKIENTSTIDQKNCICNVTIANQVMNESLILRRHYGSPYAAPRNDNYGLAVDISYYRSGPAIKPIQCTKNIPTRIDLNKGLLLQLKSRLIKGDFTKGYCIQISRTPTPSDTNLSLAIKCDDAPQTKRSTTTFMATSSSTSVVMSSSPLTTVKETTQTQVTTKDLTSTKGPITTTRIPSTTDPTTHILNKTDSQINSEDKVNTLSIAIGTCCGGFVILTIISIILIKRKIFNSAIEKNIYDSRVHPHVINKSEYDGLHQDTLRIPVQEHVVMEGYYNDVELEPQYVNQNSEDQNSYSVCV